MTLRTALRSLALVGLLLAVSVPASAQTYYPFGAVTIGSTSSVRIGPVGGAVSTADPTFTNGQIHPFSITTGGRLRTQAMLFDGTDTALITATAGGSLQVECTSGCGGSGGSSIADDAVFTPGTTSITVAGGTFDDVSPDSVNEGDAGAIRMSANRNAYTTIRDAAGNERGVNVTAGNRLQTSATIDAAIPAGTNNIGDVDVLSMPADATELPAAAALADNTANPTVPGVGSFMMCWDGTNWDRCPTSAGGVGVSDANTTRVVPAQQTPFRSLDLDETEEEIKASAGEVCSVWVTNTATATRWLKFYNATAASVTVGTTTPLITIGIPGNATDDVSGSFATSNGCLAFGTAITVAATTGVADADTGAPGANDVIVMVGFR